MPRAPARGEGRGTGVVSSGLAAFGAAPCHRPLDDAILAVPEPACGALAQLGERLICIQEVIGSIPIGSTTDLTMKGMRCMRFIVRSRTH